jgi:hypothetical protein
MSFLLFLYWVDQWAESRGLGPLVQEIKNRREMIMLLLTLLNLLALILW